MATASSVLANVCHHFGLIASIRPEIETLESIDNIVLKLRKNSKETIIVWTERAVSNKL